MPVWRRAVGSAGMTDPGYNITQAPEGITSVLATWQQELLGCFWEEGDRFHGWQQNLARGA